MSMKTGWEFDDLYEQLKNNPDTLIPYCEDYPLCAIHSTKRQLIIVRKYNYQMEGETVILYSGEPYGDNGHWGFTFIDLDQDFISSMGQPLPEKHTYQSVYFQENSVLINSKEKQFLTNWNELNRKFPFLTNFTEDELIEIYDSLKNDVVIPKKIEWKKPTKSKIETNFIGTLKLTKSKDSYIVKTHWNNSEVEVRFLPDKNGEIEQGIETAIELWKKTSSWDEQIKNYAANELLPIKNDSWLNDKEEELTTTMFINCMTLISITFYEEGEFEFFFDDGDLFWGHSIHVSGDIKNGMTLALFQG